MRTLEIVMKFPSRKALAHRMAEGLVREGITDPGEQARILARNLLEDGLITEGEQASYEQKLLNDLRS